MHQELVENRRWLLERLPLGGGHGAADKSFGPRQYVIHVIGVSAIIGMILKTLS
jgi:hypothetical protein